MNIIINIHINKCLLFILYILSQVQSVKLNLSFKNVGGSSAPFSEECVRFAEISPHPLSPSLLEIKINM